MNFQKLIELREDSSLKQKDIANVLNITQQTYSLWENGTKIIPLKHLNSLCNYYDVSMDYVLGLSNVRQYDIVNRVIDKKIIGIKLKEFRKEKNITQYRLEQNSGILHGTMQCIMSGRTSKIMMNTVMMIARGFDMTLIEFIDDDLFRSNELEIE